MVVGHTLPDSRLPGTNKSHAGKPRITMRSDTASVCASAIGLENWRGGDVDVDGNGILLTHYTSHSLFGVVWSGVTVAIATSALPCLSAVWMALQLGYLARQETPCHLQFGLGTPDGDLCPCFPAGCVDENRIVSHALRET